VPEAQVNGITLHYEFEGRGEPLALVHGSWGDARSWGLVLPGLAKTFRVLTYDRRGHSRSDRPDTPGNVDEDGDDLAALLEALEASPAHVAANSFGGNIALRLATRRPELFRSLCCHEPPLFGVLDDDPEAQDMLARDAHTVATIGRRIADGEHEGAARQFVEEVVMGPGAWDVLPAETKAIMVDNAPTYLDELQDPEQSRVEPDALARLEVPTRFTDGTESPPVLARVTERLVQLIPGATRQVMDGAGHVPHLTTPARYVDTVTRTHQFR
jgi:pimeloyl-ACP methyl ester carboxylesterase